MRETAWTITHEPDAVTAVRGDEAITLVTTGRLAGRLWARRGEGGSVLIDDCHLALAALLAAAVPARVPPNNDSEQDGA